MINAGHTCYLIYPCVVWIMSSNSFCHYMRALWAQMQLKKKKIIVRLKGCLIYANSNMSRFNHSRTTVLKRESFHAAEVWTSGANWNPSLENSKERQWHLPRGTAEFDACLNDQLPPVTHRTRDWRAHAVCWSIYMVGLYWKHTFTWGFALSLCSSQE